MAIVYLSLGSNLGDREEYLRQARLKINQPPRTLLLQESKILNTTAMDVVNQPDFLNQVIQIETTLDAERLLDQIQGIEKELGRVKRFDKGPREIDIDILLYEHLILQTERLSLPHHSIESRPFIRDLLREIKRSPELGE